VDRDCRSGAGRGRGERGGARHRRLAERQASPRAILPAYGFVLATNIWQFRQVGANGAVVESFDLAADEAASWALANGPRRDTLRGRFAAFLQRCPLTRAPLARPSNVAFFLASYAREALARHSGNRVGLSHRRLPDAEEMPGAEEMAELPRPLDHRPRAVGGGSRAYKADRALDRGGAPARTRSRRVLSRLPARGRDGVREQVTSHWR